MDPLTYYATQSPISDPGENVGLFADLPSAIDDLCRVVQGLCILYRTGEMYNYQIPEERLDEINTRYMDEMLARIIELDDRSLIEPRRPQERLVGSCRDFALLFCAMARSQGIPARVRVGFATYFTGCTGLDSCSHLVAEMWDAGKGRWRLIDPQLDDVQIQENHVKFDTHDVPRDRFLVGGQAWQTCRSGEADPNRFGIGDIKGLGIIRGNLIQDLAAQNKMELLDWDCWGLMLRNTDSHTDEELSLIDRVAVLTQASNDAFPEMRAIYETESDLTVPRVVMCFDPVGEPREVTLRIPQQT